MSDQLNNQIDGKQDTKLELPEHLETLKNIFIDNFWPKDLPSFPVNIVLTSQESPITDSFDLSSNTLNINIPPIVIEQMLRILIIGNDEIDMADPDFNLKLDKFREAQEKFENYKSNILKHSKDISELFDDNKQVITNYIANSFGVKNIVEVAFEHELFHAYFHFLRGGIYPDELVRVDDIVHRIRSEYPDVNSIEVLPVTLRYEALDRLNKKVQKSVITELRNANISKGTIMLHLRYSYFQGIEETVIRMRALYKTHDLRNFDNLANYSTSPYFMLPPFELYEEFTNLQKPEYRQGRTFDMVSSSERFLNPEFVEDYISKFFSSLDTD